MVHLCIKFCIMIYAHFIQICCVDSTSHFTIFKGMHIASHISRCNLKIMRQMQSNITKVSTHFLFSSCTTCMTTHSAFHQICETIKFHAQCTYFGVVNIGSLLYSSRTNYNIQHEYSLIARFYFQELTCQSLVRWYSV